MKRKKPMEYIDIFIGDEENKCSKCLHIRKGEPYAGFSHFGAKLKLVDFIVCWRCCRDHDSTLLIFRKWPLAFNRRAVGPYYHLEWADSLQEGLELNDEAQKTD